MAILKVYLCNKFQLMIFKRLSLTKTISNLPNSAKRFRTLKMKLKETGWPLQLVTIIHNGISASGLGSQAKVQMP